MYPQFIQSPMYQPLPQFTPEVRLSPQNIVQEYEEVPQFEPEMIPQFDPIQDEEQVEFPVTFSPRATVIPPRVPIEYEEVEPEINIVSPRITRMPIEYEEVEPITRFSVPRVVEQARPTPIRVVEPPVTRISPPRVIEEIRPVTRINPSRVIEQIRPVTRISPPRVIEEIEPITRISSPRVIEDIRPVTRISSPRVIEEIRPVTRISPPRVIEQIRPPVTRISPPRVIEQIRPVTRISPPRVIEEIRPPVTRISPPKVVRMPERVTTLPPPIRNIAQFNQQEDVTLTDLPRDVLIEMLINLPPGRLFDLCGTSVALSRLCNDESFLKDLIGRQYGVSINLIPGGTIKERYAFISRFDPRYFTDPDFVKINPSYKRDFGLDYTSRKSPNDALNTIISIMVDSEISNGFNVLRSIDMDHPGGGQIIKPGIYNSRLVRLLSGAMMTKSQSFVKQILSILIDKISPLSWGSSWGSYNDSFRNPFILSIEYGMTDITKLLSRYYNYEGGGNFYSEAIDEIVFADSINILDRFIPYIVVSTLLFYNLYDSGKYDLADYILDKLRILEMDITHDLLRILEMDITHDRIDNIRYLLKHIPITQEYVDWFLSQGNPDVARLFQERLELQELEKKTSQ